MRKKYLIALIFLGIIIPGIYFYSTGDTEQKQSVIVWQTEVDPDAQRILSEIEVEFEKNYPNVDLKIESVSWGNLSKKLAISIRNNTLPDIAHIQPYMAYSFIEKGLLSPITEFVQELDEGNGGIWPAVRDLQKYDDEYYGIAYAVGTTFWVTRADYLNSPSDEIASVKTWEDYLSLVRRVKGQNDNATVILPGGSPFFIDQLYAELLANAGGKLFDPKKQLPLLNSDENKAVLRFFRDLAETGALDPSWATQTYLDQFKEVAVGNAFSVPVTYARASRTISKQAKLSKKVSDPSPSLFRWLNQPVSSSSAGIEPIATIDCEPFVVFKVASERSGISGKSNKELGIEFLRLFYSEEFYTRFTSAVPIHLTPIFKDISSSKPYLKSIGTWMPWHKKTMALLSSNSTRPILMPDTTEEGRKLPFLFEFQGSRILSSAVSQAILDPKRTISSIADEAQEKTNSLLKMLRRVKDQYSFLYLQLRESVSELVRSCTSLPDVVSVAARVISGVASTYKQSKLRHFTSTGWGTHGHRIFALQNVPRSFFRRP